MAIVQFVLALFNGTTVCGTTALSILAPTRNVRLRIVP
jgi:hypothetical protein